MLAFNALLAFAVEIAALFAWGLFGWQQFETLVVQIAAAGVGAGLFALLWGVFAAPKSARRLRQPWLAPFKAAMFMSGGVAFAAAGLTGAGLVLAVAGAVQIALALSLDAL